MGLTNILILYINIIFLLYVTVVSTYPLIMYLEPLIVTLHPLTITLFILLSFSNVFIIGITGNPDSAGEGESPSNNN